jgi:NTE family protein
MVAKWGSDLFLSKITKRLLLKSLLDASPLSQTLLLHIHFWKVSRAIRSGRVKGLAISTTNYHDGSLTIFYDSTEPITPWVRERRRAIRTPIRIRHIMASCSIPVLFEPVPIGDFLYGDGSLRFSFPFSPAVHLGANKIFAIGVSGVSTLIPPINDHKDSLSIGFVAGSVLNSIFLDSLDNDYENLCRINEIVGPNSPKYKPVFLMRPSGNLAALASEHLKDVPFHLRQLLSSSAKPDEMGDVLSYLMFSPGYVATLLEMGRKDAEKRHDELEAFLKE